MSKAILVIDMPESCAKCPFVEHEDEGWLYCSIHNSDTAFAFKRADWCPLKELPERKNVNWLSDNAGWSRGWNDCLKEILEK